MLKLNEISKSFPQRGSVLDKLSLEVKEGETLAVIGPSGSGKTTLLNIIGLLDRPDKGSVFFNEKEITGFDHDEASAFRRNNIGFVFQDHMLLPHLNIIENILLPTLAAGKRGKDTGGLDSYIDKLMERTGITELKNKFPWQVSGGEAQRATLVRALVNKPALLLADEPTGSLDAGNADELAGLLMEMNSITGTTVIAVTHSLALAEKMQKTLELKNGSLGDPDKENKTV
ncbi:MAG: ABC transporter ATP-binding protein [Bacteroidales bacterium]|jgi:lipoprotein-releasing system ATP-binding protein|nr:ABC transporter ATP-binding protein [Bacteroidales bacterium]